MCLSVVHVLCSHDSRTIYFKLIATVSEVSDTLLIVISNSEAIDGLPCRTTLSVAPSPSAEVTGLCFAAAQHANIYDTTRIFCAPTDGAEASAACFYSFVVMKSSVAGETHLSISIITPHVQLSETFP